MSAISAPVTVQLAGRVRRIARRPKERWGKIRMGGQQAATGQPAQPSAGAQPAGLSQTLRRLAEESLRPRFFSACEQAQSQAYPRHRRHEVVGWEAA
uniref:Uncharacterized protein n=1 Tax=Sphaerodactylus townsendi TaxID=933632 RepID=A0ACB8EVD0_9SAUR